jgi:hypothetical protein
MDQASVTRGLDPRVHPFREKRLAKVMDCRVKPGNDDPNSGASLFRDMR